MVHVELRPAVRCSESSIVTLRKRHDGVRSLQILTGLPTLPPARCRGLCHVLLTVCFTLCAIAVSGTTAADPRSSQCWTCLHRLAMELPAINPEEDPLYEQGLTPGSVLPALAHCSLDDGEIPTLQQIIKVFADAQAEHGGAAYVREHLAHLPGVNADDRAHLVDGATQDLDTTLRHLVDHNCRILLKSHFNEGASRRWILQMIELGRTSHEVFLNSV